MAAAAAENCLGLDGGGSAARLTPLITNLRTAAAPEKIANIVASRDNSGNTFIKFKSKAYLFLQCSKNL